MPSKYPNKTGQSYVFFISHVFASLVIFLLYFHDKNKTQFWMFAVLLYVCIAGHNKLEILYALLLNFSLIFIFHFVYMHYIEKKKTWISRRGDKVIIFRRWIQHVKIHNSNTHSHVCLRVNISFWNQYEWFITNINRNIRQWKNRSVYLGKENNVVPRYNEIIYNDIRRKT